MALGRVLWICRMLLKSSSAFCLRWFNASENQPLNFPSDILIHLYHGFLFDSRALITFFSITYNVTWKPPSLLLKHLGDTPGKKQRWQKNQNAPQPCLSQPFFICQKVPEYVRLWKVSMDRIFRWLKQSFICRTVNWKRQTVVIIDCSSHCDSHLRPVCPSML